MKKILLILLTIPLMATQTNVKTYIPTRAYTYYPAVLKAVDNHFSEFILPPYFGSLIEHESCISLRSKRCWSPRSRFKTSREEGIGLGMITRTWRKSGRLRFDKLSELRHKYKELKDFTWKNVRDRPDLQITAIVLMWKDMYKKLNKNISEYDRMAMVDSAYNGGVGGLRKDRRKCGLVKGCNPNLWFDNVEKTCTKSRKILYGKRSACDINRHHVKDVMTNRLNKYIYLWFEYK